MQQSPNEATNPIRMTTAVPETARGPRRPHALWLGVLLVAIQGCGSPPEGLDGFELGMSQRAVMDQANSRPGFGCRLVASRPKLTYCSGPTDHGMLEAAVRGDSTVRVTMEVARNADDPAEATRRFARGFGEPAWRDRPFPPDTDPPDGYHTYWIDSDTTRGIAMICRGPDLGPPCNARLAITSPDAVQATLDSLLNVQR